MRCTAAFSFYLAALDFLRAEALRTGVLRALTSGDALGEPSDSATTLRGRPRFGLSAATASATEAAPFGVAAALGGRPRRFGASIPSLGAGAGPAAASGCEVAAAARVRRCRAGFVTFDGSGAIERLGGGGSTAIG